MIFSPFERMVALRYLRPRRQGGFVSVIAGFSFAGIALGVMTLIIVMSVMNGFRSELVSRIVGADGHVAVAARDGGPLRGYVGVLERLEADPEVVGAAPHVSGHALVAAGVGSTGVLVRGMRAADALARPAIATGVTAGDLEALDDGAIAVGSRLAERLGLRVGDSLTLLSPQPSSTAFGSVPRALTAPVGAVFSVGMSDFDGALVLMGLDRAQAFYRHDEDVVTSIEVTLRDPERAMAVAARISAETGLSAADWQRSRAGLFATIAVERNVMFLILSLIVLVAAFNIVSGLTMLVKDKTRDIAVLRTMGATRSMILRVFMLAGSSIGIAGTALGVAAGLAFCAEIETIRRGIEMLTGTDLFSAEIYFLSRLPAKVDWHEVVHIAGMSLALSLAASAYPAWRAARLEPVEALRDE